MSLSEFLIPNLFSVSGKTVVVTGGGTGLGKAITSGFAANGAKVYIVGRRFGVLEETAREIENGLVDVQDVRGSVIPIQGDVSTREGCFAFRDKIAERETAIDCLVNCAGILLPAKVTAKDHNDVDQVQALLESVTDEDIANQSAINVAGPLFTTVAFAPMLSKAEDGNVIIIASIAALGIHKKMGSLTYAISKAGTVNVAAQLASRLIPYGVRVNCICPGIYPSQMTARGSDHSQLSLPVQDAIATIPAGRLGSPPDIAGPCIMLTSRAGSYMNSATLIIDGGRVMTLSSNM